ncbi:MAG: inositol monophosphatase [Oscillospiraceae bacterium]|nr:inositol monophosphatase [Oscillospiraceae bacterium]
MSDLSYAEICSQLVRAEREAAKLILQAHDILAECKTGKRDVVTEYDRRVQDSLISQLQTAFPDAVFFAEEKDTQGSLSAPRLFIIDPIDGTMNFVHGFHHSCISIAYAEYGVTRAAAIYNPYMDEMFTAVSGEGAFLNGKAIHVTENALSDSMVCFGTAPYYPELTETTFHTLRLLYDVSLDLRREGSAALDLCSVAAGRAGLYVEQRVSLWDYAAGDLLVREAGGRCCRPDGSAFPENGEKTGVLAGSPKTAEEYLALIRKDGR